MGVMTVRLSEDLHAKVRKAAAPHSQVAWVREAIAEKAGRVERESDIEEMKDEIRQLRDRLARLERELAGRRG